MNGLKQKAFKQQSIVWLIFGSALMLIAGCQPLAIETGSTSGNTTTDSNAGSVTIIATEEPQSEDAASIAGDASMISLSAVEQVIATSAATQLAEELGIDTAAISITAMDSVEWPDASLGCPEEGMMYAAVLTSGYKIMLEVDGQTHEYHSNDREDAHVVKCDPKTE